MRLRPPKSMLKWKIKQAGFTLIELIVGVVGLALFAASIYIIYLIICALQKYINS